MNRAELRQRILESRANLEAELAGYSEADWTAANLAGGWSAQDVMAHIGWWERRIADTFQALTTGATPPEGITADALDAINAQTFAEYHGRPLAEVRRFEQAAYQDLLRIVDTASEEELFDPRHFAHLQGGAFMDLIVWNTYDHFDEHLAMLKAGRTAAGIA
jgi:hypothetical protein